MRLIALVVLTAAAAVSFALRPELAGTITMYLVVGGAYLALGALAEDPRLRVLLLDRSDFPRDKSCGDGIAPHVLDALAQVGAGDVVDDWTPLRHLSLSHGDVAVSGPMRREVHVVPVINAAPFAMLSPNSQSSLMCG